MFTQLLTYSCQVITYSQIFQSKSNYSLLTHTWIQIYSSYSLLTHTLKASQLFALITWAVTRSEVNTLTLPIPAQSCNKNFPENCRPCDEFSYWRNLKEKRNEFEISDHDWKGKNLASFYDVNDGECQNQECSCDFGSKRINNCTENQQQYCTTCDDGYYLVGDNYKSMVCKKKYSK